MPGRRTALPSTPATAPECGLRIGRVPGLLHDPLAAAARPLPGVRPVGDGPWLRIGTDYADLMAERVRLLAERRGDVVALRPQGEEAATELLDEVVRALGAVPGFAPAGPVPGRRTVSTPDGRVVPLDASDPLGTLGRLLPADLCLMVRTGEEHVLAGAVLCFPASWRLAEKIGRPLTEIHGPVPEYPGVAARVQRLFDGVQVGRPLWRANALWYGDPALYQPRSEASPRREAGDRPWLRTERQVIWRLPRSRAVVFAIETTVLPRAMVGV